LFTVSTFDFLTSDHMFISNMSVSVFREYACTELTFESGKRTVG